MNRATAFIVLVVSALALTGCSVEFVGEPFDPPARSATAIGPTASPQELDADSIQPGEVIYYRVGVPASVRNASEVIYFDVDVGDDESADDTGALSLEVLTATGSSVAASVSPNYFGSRLSGLEPTGTAGFSISAIGTTFGCFGPCAIVPDSSDTYYVRIENSSSNTVDYAFYAFGFELQDTGENGNDSAATAPFLSGFEEGAIETLGDEDYYEVSGNGVLEFTAAQGNPLDLRLQIGGDTISPGSSIQVFSGEVVRVYSRAGYAGAPSASAGRYTLELQ